MSHEIDMSNGQANIAYVGEKPWHGLGQELTEGATIDQWIREAGLNFTAIKTPLQFTVGNERIEYAGRHALYRSDTKAPLGIVADGYNVVQPKQIMDFFERIAKVGDFKLETAGSLYGGKKVWALARIGEGQKIIGSDEVRPYVLMATSFDGSTSTVGKLTGVRVVCNNTISIALQSNEGGKMVRVPHHANFSPDVMAAELGIALGSWKIWLDQTRNMAETAMPGVDADEFLVKLLAKKKVEPEDIRESTTYRRLMGLFEGGAIGTDLTGGRTQWQMLNAVTQLVDHVRGNDRNTRMNAAWFGAGDALKNKAFNLLVNPTDAQPEVEAELEE